jgi:hypothetical protein
MKNVYFRVAGKRKPNEPVFFATSNRLKCLSQTIYHRNAINTDYAIPVDFFKLHFTYDKTNRIYRNALIFSDIQKYIVERA